ncbi:E2/UBC family protein [Brevundimonas sp. 3P9-tot-E]|jgi:Prokaryotic E2 family E|uniref:E2/UBC family protein n=1 Tax=Brevundimonas TaxID=41275 RepID=UPI0008C62789|nr:MAG: hypothetical protein A2352_09120 [Caulobacterales bacterium RIFOXYB1_FULL_67_16]
MRRDFQLPDNDVRALDALGLTWDAVRDGAARYVIVRSHPVPEGYTATEVDVAYRVDAYPPGPLDMAYIRPALARTDGKVINNLSQITIEGRTYQQWSRHYPFQSGVDTLCSHMRRFRSWLSHEFRKR